MKLSRIQKLIVVAVGLVMTAGVILQGSVTYRNDMNAKREQAALNAQIYAVELDKDFQRGISISDTLEAMIINSNGNIDNFDAIAALFMEDYVGSIQLAPNGKVTHIYPLEGNEAGLGDLMSDPKRGPVVKYGMEHKVTTLQGPFDLWQGGQGVAVRNPVFLDSGDGSKTFWGFTIVILKVPEVYSQSLGALASFGYDYCVDAQISPLETETKRVTASLKDGIPLTDPESASFKVGECEWAIYVQPSAGWKSRRLVTVIVVGLVYDILATALVYLLLGLYQQRKQLRILAERDALTGLYSRRGFMANFEKLGKSKRSEPMTVVFIDLDDFKLINDLYGHLVGDEALKDLSKNLQLLFPKDALIGRTGGDEFCVALWGMTAGQANELIQKIFRDHRSFNIVGHEYSYTISAGYADYPAQATDRAHLMTLADQALYAAKMAGKHQCLHFEPSMADIKRSKLAFNVKNIAEGIPGAYLVYKANEEEEIIFANDDLIHLFDCENFADFLEHTKGSFRYFVHPDDRERVLNSVNEQIKIQKKRSGYSKKYYDDLVEYRIITRDGDVKTVFDIGRLMKMDNYGDVFCVYLRESDTIRNMKIEK